MKSVFKALDILEAFEDRPRHLSLGDLVKATGLDKSAVQRFTHTLVQRGYLEQDPNTRRFALGRQILAVSFDFLRGQELIARAAPILLDLRNTLQERVDLSLRHGDMLLYVMRLQHKRETYSAGLIGRRLPLYFSAGGRAMLSKLSDEEAHAIVTRSDRLKRTPKTQTDVEAIMQAVRRARDRGYAIQAEEGKLDEVAAAAAITDSDGTPVAAVHVAASLNEWSISRFEERVASLIVSAAQEISR
ncbi:MAG: IclR family transcriptional regulator [Aquamicrobium sp.]|nr:IclR family transcriptional regulator [Aquamicrobium sp.]